MDKDPFADEARREPPKGHQLGQDLSDLSVAELDERIALLTAEIERLRRTREAKQASRSAAASVFKL